MLLLLALATTCFRRSSALLARHRSLSRCVRWSGGDDDDTRWLDVAALEGAARATNEASRLEDMALLNSAFRLGGGEQEQTAKMPLNVAAWTYTPGLREILHVHRPALVYLFEEVVLTKRPWRYVHALHDATVGVLVEVVDFHRDDKRGSLFAVVHATRRVRITRGAAKRGPVDLVEIEPFLDAEEREEHGEWVAVDDAYAPTETWLRDGQLGRITPDFTSDTARRLAAPEEPDLSLAKVEAEVWWEMDALVDLIRKSRSSGEYALPDALLALRPEKQQYYPAARRALRLSYSLGVLLELGQGEERQQLLDSPSTRERLEFARSRLCERSRQLAAALALESIRRDNDDNKLS